MYISVTWVSNCSQSIIINTCFSRSRISSGPSPGRCHWSRWSRIRSQWAWKFSDFCASSKSPCRPRFIATCSGFVWFFCWSARSNSTCCKWTRDSFRPAAPGVLGMIRSRNRNPHVPCTRRTFVRSAGRNCFCCSIHRCRSGRFYLHEWKLTVGQL